MKKVNFNAKRPSTPAGVGTEVDNWVANRPPEAEEATKRLTIDVPGSLHKRIKVHCAVENLIMADELRRLLEEKFPEPAATGRGEPDES